MTPAEIPRLQSKRVALFVQRFGQFDSGKNAYWSLRKERPVTLAEGARFDADMRAGRLAPVVRRATAVPSRTGGYTRAARLPVPSRIIRDRAPMPEGPPLRRVMVTTMRVGWWRNSMTGQVRQGTAATPPSRMAGWRWTLGRPSGAVSKVQPRMPVAPPQEKLLHMPTEAKRIDALPTTPPPGPARPPSEPLFEAIMRQLREKQAGPATSIVEARPAFATPGPTFASAVPSATPIAAGFDMKKLALPLALVAGAFVVSKLV